MGSNYIVFPADQLEDNPVHQPRAARVTKGHHVYDPTILNNKAVGYKPVTYDRAEHEFPKMLYHPEYGLKAKPQPHHFFSSADTADKQIAAHDAFNEAMKAWERGNRTKIANDAKEEERLKKIGWLSTAPQPAKKDQFDSKSDAL